ncbi:hypothetical protein Hdeb2414_s0012g00394721 [Helianthus debilis subsp. tardiflorus]
MSGAPRKRPSNLPFLDYVVISDTLSSLDAGNKHAERDPDDDVTLMEITKKKKILEDKKKELDEQAAATLAEKKSKLQKETTTPPSELVFDLAVFSAKAGNLLEKMYKSAFGSRGTILSVYDDVEVEQVGKGGAASAGGDEGGGGGTDTEVESSEATPRRTIYTKRPPGSGGGGTSGTRQSPEF